MELSSGCSGSLSDSNEEDELEELEELLPLLLEGPGDLRRCLTPFFLDPFSPLLHRGLARSLEGV